MSREMDNDAKQDNVATMAQNVLAAPILYHALAKTYSSSSSCVEHPIQRQFLALAAKQNFLLFGGDAQDTFAHSPAPEVPLYS